MSKLILLFFNFCLLAACSACNQDSGPVPIELSRDACSSCKMTIVDGRYGGEFVSDKGKIYKFDAVDCLIQFQRKNPTLQGKTYISNFAQPGTLIEATQVIFATLDTRKSPMGSRYVGFSSAAEAQASLGDLTQPLMSWPELFKNLSR